MALAVGVCVGVEVGVGLPGVMIEVRVAVFEAVEVGVSVADAVGVAVMEGLGVGVMVDVGVTVAEEVGVEEMVVVGVKVKVEVAMGGGGLVGLLDLLDVQAQGNNATRTQPANRMHCLIRMKTLIGSNRGWIDR